MFADVAAARETLSEYFYEESVDMLLGHLRPAIAFEPIEGSKQPGLGATRLGGTPDLPAEKPWPVRPRPVDADAIAARGGHRHGGHIGRHLASARPFEFIAQVDLAEAARLGDIAADLPNEGRLLFFYDVSVGPWHDGAESCRVVWDTSPVASLTRLPLPEILIDLHVEEYALAGGTRCDRSAVNENATSPYWGPARAMRLHAMLRLPDWRSAEWQAGDSLAEQTLVAALEDEDFEASVQALFDDNIDTASRHQLLGLPLPVQSDPRYSAVILTEFGEQHLAPKVWQDNQPRISRAARQWHLLLQIDLKDYFQQTFVEGTVYFLIHRDDLAARAFDKVLAVYQQS
jgi:Domain of unknown function (DUF1963)